MTELLLDIGAVTALIAAATAIAAFAVTMQRRRERQRQQERLDIAFSRAQTTRTRGGTSLFGHSEA